MLEHLKDEANRTLTENLAATHRSTLSFCLDLFASIGALRNQNDDEIIKRFMRAYTEDSDMAMKILFYARTKSSASAMVNGSSDCRHII